MKTKFSVIYVSPTDPGRFRALFLGEQGQRLELHGLDAEQAREFSRTDSLGQLQPAATDFRVAPCRPETLGETNLQDLPAAAAEKSSIINS